MKNRRQLKPEAELVREEPELHPWLDRLRNLAGFVLIAAVSLGAAWGVRRYLMTSPRFALEQVEIEGQRTRTKEQLLERAHVKMGVNVFSIDLATVRSALLGDPYVERATVARRLPNTLLVTIEERAPVAVVIIGADPFLATREGITFKHLEVGDPTDLPVITGLGRDLAESDHDAFAAQVSRALDIALDYQQSQLGPKMTLQEIHVEAGSVSLAVGSQAQGVVSLTLGQSPWRRKLEEASRVVAELERRGQKPDVIMLDQTARPERVVARVR